MLATNIRPQKTSGVIIEVTSVKIDGAAIVQIKRSADPKQFTATITPSNATNQTLRWESSNTNLFKVDPNTGVVTPPGPTGTTGSAQLRVYAHNEKSTFIMIQIT